MGGQVKCRMWLMTGWGVAYCGFINPLVLKFHACFAGIPLYRMPGCRSMVVNYDSTNIGWLRALFDL